MAHPRNKAERQAIGKAKGRKRTWWATAEFCSCPEIQERRHRDTTTTCSNPECCGNPRRRRKGQERYTMQERRNAA